MCFAWCCSGQLLLQNPLSYFGAQEIRLENPGQLTYLPYPSLINPLQPLIKSKIDEVKAVNPDLSPLLYSQPIIPSHPYPIITSIKTSIEDSKAVAPSRSRRDADVIKPFQVPLTYTQPLPTLSGVNPFMLSDTVRPIMYSAPSAFTPFYPIQNPALLSNPLMPIMPLQLKEEKKKM